VKIAAHHVHKRGGVLLGDVVGLGKTLMATALARILADDLLLETLVLCPLNIVPMWEDYCHEYRVPSCRVLSYSKVISKLPELRRYRLVILDESHNLRNREGKTYKVIADYLQKNDSKCVLLSATPYNKDYLDLASQLRLFVPADQDLGVGPQRLLQEMGEIEFVRQHQCGVRTLAAFEHSPHPDDWRELMRLYMVRRTRGFIKENYAETDPANGRKYLRFSDGTRSYFPDRMPKKVPFKVDDSDPTDLYAKLYGPDVVDLINHLDLPRYGLGNFVLEKPKERPTAEEDDVLANLSVAGTRLMGFCRTNLFKRLESSGYCFLLSVERHILRNFIYLHAVENNLELPIGTQDAGLLDTRANDSDEDGPVRWRRHSHGALFDPRRTFGSGPLKSTSSTRNPIAHGLAGFGHFSSRRNSATACCGIRARCSRSSTNVTRGTRRKTRKLKALIKLVAEKHKHDKVLIFSQFGDTVEFLGQQLKNAGVQAWQPPPAIRPT
jgi:hypothetical protein